MITLNGLTSVPSQRFTQTINEEVATFVLEYKAAIQMWFISISYKNVEINNMRVCHNINLIAQYSNRVNFGLFVEPVNGVEPVLIDDFSSGRFRLNILNQDEIDQIEAGYSTL